MGKGLGRMADVTSAPSQSSARHWMIALGAFIVVVGVSMVISLMFFAIDKPRAATSMRARPESVPLDELALTKGELRARPLAGVNPAAGQA
jgi:hypothetical protein